MSENIDEKNQRDMGRLIEGMGFLKESQARIESSVERLHAEMSKQIEMINTRCERRLINTNKKFDDIRVMYQKPNGDKSETRVKVAVLWGIMSGVSFIIIQELVKLALNKVMK